VARAAAPGGLADRRPGPARVSELFPSVQEVFFDDDTFTDDRQRAEQIARGLGKLGLTWSCNAKANVPYETLKVLRDNGLRLLLVGYESGNQQILINIKKGVRVDRARQFTKDCRDLGITIHGTFIVGLPGETTETIRFAKEINSHSLQVSIAAPYPGTALYRQARENGWLAEDDPVGPALAGSGSAAVARVRDYAPLGGLLPELAAQLAPGPVQPGHHGADRAAHDVRDLPVAEAFQVGQVDRGAEVRRQFLQRPDD
jgi:hypothetical protein